jgi:hypothetical protein
MRDRTEQTTADAGHAPLRRAERARPPAGPLSVLALQRSAGNRAVAAALSHLTVQRHADFEQIVPGDEQPEVTVPLDGESVDPQTAGQQPTVQESSGESHVTVNRQDIPAPPPAYPNMTAQAGARTNDGDALSIDLTSLWSMSCADGLERGFPIHWNQKSGAIWRGDTVMGPKRASPGDRAYITIPFDDPPGKDNFMVGSGHTHPPPSPGYKAKTVGPSDIDLGNLGAKRPGMVVDFSTTASRRNDATLYFFGPETRQD